MKKGYFRDNNQIAAIIVGVLCLLFVGSRRIFDLSDTLNFYLNVTFLLAVLSLCSYTIYTNGTRANTENLKNV